MTLPTRCSADCVIPVDRSDAYPLSASTRPDGAWVIGEAVVRTIADAGHRSDHPFSFEGAGATVEERGQLLARIMESNPKHVLPVTAICSCSYESPFILGHPLQDFGLGADTNKLIHPRERRIRWAPIRLEHHLAELASGLQGLHELGIAHGDPALMNAYVNLVDEPVALWVDLNSVQSAGPEAINVDIAAFEATCVWPALLDADLHSPSLFAELVELAMASPEPLSSYVSALTKTRDDHTPHQARGDLLDNLARTDPSNRPDPLGRVRRRVAAAMAPGYFLDQTLSDQNARFFSSTLAVERARHQLLEEERTRLHGIRYLDEIAALTARIRDLDSEVLALQERIANGVDVIEAREALDSAHIALDELREELSNERAYGTELGNENARLTNALNDIYVSRAWSWVTTTRRIAAMPSRLADKLRPSRGRLAEADTLAASQAPRPWTPPVESYPFLVSVIMPVYNKGATLRSSIDSVKAQTLGAVEIVIWDDGSTDPETLSALDEASNMPDVVMFRAPNQGVVGARNSAIALSRGRYICCLDPDDQIAPTYLEQAVALLESQPQYAITYPMGSFHRQLWTSCGKPKTLNQA